MLKVFMQPQYDVPDRAEGGIRRVVEAMQQYLPQYGVEIVNDIRVADVTAATASCSRFVRMCRL